MKSPLLREVTEAESRQFLRDGVICLRNVIAPEWVELARAGIEDQRRAPSPYATVVDHGSLYFLVDQMPTLSNEKLKRVAFESGTARIARDLVGLPSVRWVYDQLFYKGAGQVAETPWHQDTAYSFLDGPNLVRVWMPVDPVPRQTAIEVVRGSHLWNVEYATIRSIKVLEENREHTTEGSFSYLDKQAETKPDLPDIEAHRDAFDILGYEVEPGDVVAFNYHVLHHAGAGLNPHARRRALAIIYGDERSTVRHRPNPVPGPLEHAGIAYRDGQAIAEFPEMFVLA